MIKSNSKSVASAKKEQNELQIEVRNHDAAEKFLDQFSSLKSLYVKAKKEQGDYH